jgi:hypothetical protein
MYALKGEFTMQHRAVNCSKLLVDAARYALQFYHAFDYVSSTTDHKQHTRLKVYQQTCAAPQPFDYIITYL